MLTLSWASWPCWPRGPRSATRVGFFHFNLMWVLAGIVGVFLAMDLFLFYFSWELMLVPMYFLIAIWGHENRHLRGGEVLPLHAAQRAADAACHPGALSSSHGRTTGVYTFEYRATARHAPCAAARPCCSCWDSSSPLP